MSDTSSHSIQSKASVENEKVSTPVASRGNDDHKEDEKTDLDNKEQDQDQTPDAGHDQPPSSSRSQNMTQEHEYSYLYDLIDTTSDGKLSTTEFVRALKSNPSVAEVGGMHRNHGRTCVGCCRGVYVQWCAVLYYTTLHDSACAVLYYTTLHDSALCSFALFESH